MAGKHEPAPVRRPKSWHSPALEGIDLDAIDWSHEDTVTFEELEEQVRRPSARLRGLVRRPWSAVQRRLSQRRERRLRFERGWSSGELWNLDVHLCAHLGAMLEVHAHEAVNHPPELAHEEWLGQLRVAGDALRAYDPDDGERVAAARVALHWVADNLVDLWD